MLTSELIIERVEVEMSYNYGNILNNTMSKLSYRNIFNNISSELSDKFNNVVKNVSGYYTASDMFKSEIHKFLILDSETKKQYVKNTLGFTAMIGLTSVPTSLAVCSATHTLIDIKAPSTLSDILDQIGFSPIGNQIRGHELDNNILPYVYGHPVTSRVLENVENLSRSLEYTHHKYSSDRERDIIGKYDPASDFVVCSTIDYNDVILPSDSKGNLEAPKCEMLGNSSVQKSTR